MDTIQPAMPQTPQEVYELIGIECPKCGIHYQGDAHTPDFEWIQEFQECLSCDHLHGEVIEGIKNEKI